MNTGVPRILFKGILCSLTFFFFMHKPISFSTTVFTLWKALPVHTREFDVPAFACSLLTNYNCFWPMLFLHPCFSWICFVFLYGRRGGERWWCFWLALYRCSDQMSIKILQIILGLLVSTSPKLSFVKSLKGKNMFIDFKSFSPLKEDCCIQFLVLLCPS